jgi:hypothetical protein
MKDPKDWTKDDLHQNLQHAIDVEFWTIPLYLTALYSIKGLSPDNQQGYPIAAKLVEAVVIQEMLHLELACNLSNALGHTPRFTAPKYNAADQIPFIQPPKHTIPADLRGYQVKLGPLNENQLKLFCVIELPEQKGSHDWAGQSAYRSIGELYDALELGIDHLWDQCFVGKAMNTRQKTSFQGYTKKKQTHIGFSQPVTSLKTAREACRAIVEEGEGADAGRVPIAYEPPTQQDPTDYDPGWFEPSVSHYHKFRYVLKNKHLIPDRYPLIIPVEPDDSTAKQQQSAQQALDQQFLLLLVELTNCFSQAGQMTDWFWSFMWGMTDAITAVWKAGAVPAFQAVRNWPDLVRRDRLYPGESP